MSVAVAEMNGIASCKVRLWGLRWGGAAMLGASV